MSDVGAPASGGGGGGSAGAPAPVSNGTTGPATPAPSTPQQPLKRMNTGDAIRQARNATPANGKPGIEGVREATPANDSPSDAKVNQQAIQKAAQADDPNEPITVKVNGREHKVPASELAAWARQNGGVIDAYRISKASHEKMQEAAALRRQIEEAAADLRDPRRARALLERTLGREGAYQLYNDAIYEQIQERELSPDERQRRQRETELQRRERMLQERERAIREEHQKRATEQYRSQYVQECNAALQATKLPATPMIVEMMAKRMEDALQSRYELTWQQAALEVREELRELIRNSTTQADDDALEEILGADVAKRLRKREVERLKAQQPRQQTGQYAPKETAPRRQEPQKISARSFFEQREAERDMARRRR